MWNRWNERINIFGTQINVLTVILSILGFFIGGSVIVFNGVFNILPTQHIYSYDKEYVEESIIGEIRPGIRVESLYKSLGSNPMERQTIGKDIDLLFYTFKNMYVTASVSDETVIAITFELKQENSKFSINTILGKKLTLGEATFSDVADGNQTAVFYQGGNKFPSYLVYEIDYAQYMSAGLYYYIWNCNDFKNINHEFSMRLSDPIQEVNVNKIKKGRITSLTLIDYRFKDMDLDLNNPMSQFYPDLEYSVAQYH